MISSETDGQPAIEVKTFTLSEADSKSLLAPYGIPFVLEHIVASADAAAEASRELGHPVAVKLCGDAISHKTERGLVRLGLADANAVREAAVELFAAALPEDGDVSVLVAPMVSGSRELIAGASTDPQFGPTVMIGVGGILAEAIADVSIRLIPISRTDAGQMIEDLQSRTILGPFRGEPSVDREAVIDVLVALSDVMVANRDIASIDLNPLIISGGSPIAVDALVEKVKP